MSDSTFSSAAPSDDASRETDAAHNSQPEPLWRHMVGDQLRRSRLEREETQAETAIRAGVSPQYLSEMERGVKEPSSEMIAAVAGALDLSLADLALAVSENLRFGSAVGANCQAAFALAA